MKRKLRLLLAVVLAMTMIMGMRLNTFAAVSLVGDWHIVGLGDDVDFEHNYFSKTPLPAGLTEEDGTFSVNADGNGIMYHPDSPTPVSFTIRDGVFYLDGYGSFPYLENENGEILIVDLDFVWAKSGSPSPSPTPSPNNSSAHTHNFQWQTITAPTTDADGLEGEVCSCGAIRNPQPLSAYAYALNEYATPMINAAKSGQTITFEFGEWNSFPKSFMEKLVNKSASGVTFVFHYKWNHVKQEITIPTGTPIDLNFDWYGPAKMAELYGNN